MDAWNAFNLISRNVFLHVTIIFPPLARYVLNCYYANAELFVTRGEIQSMKGTALGDTTAMAVFPITIIPLALMLVLEANQVDYTTRTAAYTDDLTVAETIIH